jgi:inosine-uridine nucleoside N-ribohydrolase
MNKLETKPVIIDNDIFGDVDDVLALTYILANPHIQVAGIVTSDEYGVNRAVYTKKFLNFLGLDIPVFPGKDLGNSRYFLMDPVSQTIPADIHTTAALYQRIQEFSQLNYLCIGPQSNLAALLSNYPQLVEKMNITVMGGSLQKVFGAPEHNVRLDVSAAQTVTGAATSRWVLADQTAREEISFTQSSELFKELSAVNHPAAKLVVENAERFFNTMYPKSYFHDPLTASAVWAQFVEFVKKKVIISETGEVELNSRGHTQYISNQVDYASFLDDFIPQVISFYSGLHNQ